MAVCGKRTDSPGFFTPCVDVCGRDVRCACAAELGGEPPDAPVVTVVPGRSPDWTPQSRSGGFGSSRRTISRPQT